LALPLPLRLEVPLLASAFLRGLPRFLPVFDFVVLEAAAAGATGAGADRVTMVVLTGVGTGGGILFITGSALGIGRITGGGLLLRAETSGGSSGCVGGVTTTRLGCGGAGFGDIATGVWTDLGNGIVAGSEAGTAGAWLDAFAGLSDEATVLAGFATGTGAVEFTVVSLSEAGDGWADADEATGIGTAALFVATVAAGTTTGREAGLEASFEVAGVDGVVVLAAGAGATVVEEDAAATATAGAEGVGLGLTRAALVVALAGAAEGSSETQRAS
jgi:hypothetical protein